MIYFIDFDGTICPGGPPTAACVRTIKKLKEHNHTVVIYSCRSNPNCVEDAAFETAEMVNFLKTYGIPFDRIEPNKPLFNFIIDDRALGVPLTPQHDVDWERIERLI
jgi:hydroxymethylpyrimidine pyrophosphatase-like HAD family hydrolase